MMLLPGQTVEIDDDVGPLRRGQHQVAAEGHRVEGPRGDGLNDHRRGRKPPSVPIWTMSGPAGVGGQQGLGVQGDAVRAGVVDEQLQVQEPGVAGVQDPEAVPAGPARRMSGRPCRWPAWCRRRTPGCTTGPAAAGGSCRSYSASTGWGRRRGRTTGCPGRGPAPRWSRWDRW